MNNEDLLHEFETAAWINGHAQIDNKRGGPGSAWAAVAAKEYDDLRREVLSIMRQNRAPYAPPAVVFTHRITPPRRPIAARFWLAVDRLHERFVSRLPPAACDPDTGLRGLAGAEAEKGQHETTN